MVEQFYPARAEYSYYILLILPLTPNDPVLSIKDTAEVIVMSATPVTKCVNYGRQKHDQVPPPSSPPPPQTGPADPEYLQLQGDDFE